jgi:hypothetical protein
MAAAGKRITNNSWLGVTLAFLGWTDSIRHAFLAFLGFTASTWGRWCEAPR